MIPARNFPAAFIFFSELCLFIFVVFGVGGCSDETNDYFQGYVEGEYVLVSSPLAGRLESLAVNRGQDVQEGTPLFILEHEREQAAVSEAEQAEAKARHILADLEKGSRPSEIAALEAGLRQARTTRDLARAEFERRQQLFHENSIPREEFDRARTELERSEAAVKQLESELETARLGARPDLLKAARAEVKKVVNSLEQVLWQLKQKSQAAPTAGFVFDTFYEQGEFVPAAYPVVSLLPPDRVKIRFFVPEPVLGRIAAGDKVTVHLDGRKNAVAAEISYISPRAEYTPPVIYSRETRARLVYMIEAVPDRSAAPGLHPGQPVDVTLEPDP